jgi:hypothetical protein
MSQTLKLRKIEYRKLNSRQKENYNFQKISGLLADYGFTTIRLSDDWNGADFLAQHANGKTILRIQLKGRLGIYKKYLRKNLWIAFPDKGHWYVWSHDKAVQYPLTKKNMRHTQSWKKQLGWSYNRVPKDVAEYLKPFALK